MLRSHIMSIQRSLGLPLFLFLSNLECSALCGIRSVIIKVFVHDKCFETCNSNKVMTSIYIIIEVMTI